MSTNCALVRLQGNLTRAVCKEVRLRSRILQDDVIVDVLSRKSPGRNEEENEMNTN